MDDGMKHPVDEKKVKFKRNIISSGKSNKRWILLITALSFVLSATLSFLSSQLLEELDILFALPVILFIILIGIIFDMIGISVTAADEVPFHAMAARKYYAAKGAIKLIRNANRVSSFCNDVVGDICGIISGTASGIVVAAIASNYKGVISIIAGLAITGLVASITVGGKALGKTFAIQNSNYIVYKVSVVLHFFSSRINTGKSKKN